MSFLKFPELGLVIPQSNVDTIESFYTVTQTYTLAPFPYDPSQMIEAIPSFHINIELLLSRVGKKTTKKGSVIDGDEEATEHLGYDIIASTDTKKSLPNIPVTSLPYFESKRQSRLTKKGSPIYDIWVKKFMELVALRSSARSAKEQFEAQIQAQEAVSSLENLPFEPNNVHTPRNQGVLSYPEYRFSADDQIKMDDYEQKIRDLMESTRTVYVGHTEMEQMIKKFTGDKASSWITEIRSLTAGLVKSVNI